MDNIEISKVTFKIGDKEIELSLSEVKELKRLLNEKLNNPPQPAFYYPMYPYWTYCSGGTTWAVGTTHWEEV